MRLELQFRTRRCRQGIGKVLLAEADRRWHLVFGRQMYSEEGFRLVTAYIHESKHKPASAPDHP